MPQMLDNVKNVSHVRRWLYLALSGSFTHSPFTLHPFIIHHFWGESFIFICFAWAWAGLALAGHSRLLEQVTPAAGKQVLVAGSQRECMLQHKQRL
jgi:hypothetical protein